jgi:Zn finger protein HypA/HybF involved in hydrogenase expression
MGNILRGSCRCGFDTDDIFVGGGFMNFMDTCNAPALCLSCNEFLVRNYIKKGTARCPACHKSVTFYDDPSLSDQSTQTEEFDWLVTWRIADRNEFFKLADTRYLCPQCKQMTLVFKDRGNWD